ncbi:MAG: radical SAM family heme chaperone HemW [Gemmatimonadaceae bacterium]
MLPRHLYIHVPFCARRCSYCDFSIAVRPETPVDEYLGALRSELALSGIDGTQLDTVYLGGGTPSRLGGPGVAAVLGAVRARASISSTAEITIEANPDDVNDFAVARWVAAGVNRISLGAQSFDDTVLRWMHRTHDSEQIGQAVRTIRRGGIENISLDLIFALPAHLGRDWKNDLERAIAMSPSHLSLYGLTVEDHTPIARWADRGAIVEGSETQYEEEFLYADQAMTGAGFQHYEVSNFSLPGRRSRHNSAYWTGAAYAGIGPSAHSFDGNIRRWNVSAYSEWARRLANGKPVSAGEELLSDENRIAESIYLGLRTTSGIEIDGRDTEVVGRWESAGWAALGRREAGGGADRLQPPKEDSSGHMTHLRLTPTGWLRLDSIAASVTALRAGRRSEAVTATPSGCYI